MIQDMEYIQPRQHTHPLSDIGAILGGSALLYLASFIKIPCYPVPFTGHTLIIFILGLTQSPKQAFGSASLYLLSGYAHPLWLIGPSGGYLIAMPFAAGCISLLKSQIKPLIALSLGQSLILICGICHLSSFIPFSQALIQGGFIFIPSAIIKIMLSLKFHTSWNRQ